MITDYYGRVGSPGRAWRPVRLVDPNPACKTPYPYHSHSAQWEFYHVISGEGTVRHQDGTTPVETGDAFLFKPGEPHQIINDSQQDILL